MPAKIIGRAFLAFAIAPSLGILLAARTLHFWFGPLFDIDFVVLGILAPWLPFSAEVVAICGLTAVALLWGVVRTYGLPISYLPVLLRAAVALPKSTLMLWVAAYVLLVALLSYVAHRAVPRGGRARLVGSLGLGVFLVLGLLVDYLGGHGPFRNGAVTRTTNESPRLSFQLLYTPAAGLARFERSRRAGRGLRGSGQALRAASLDLSPMIDNRQPTNLVLVVIESWGAPRDDVITAAFERLYHSRAIDQRYELRTGTVAFTGSTIYGEARELCDRDLGFGIIALPRDSLRTCLPWRLHESGYRTLAVHGNVGEVFGRAAWYPRIGFEQTAFGPELATQGLPRCGGFIPGICDSAAAHWIGDQLVARTSAQPSFVYWLTLNSHLPIDRTVGRNAYAQCESFVTLRSDEALCGWFALIMRAHRGIASLAARDGLPRTAFVIVGDHAPPFATTDHRKQFSTDVVPYLVLVPRGPPS